MSPPIFATSFFTNREADASARGVPDLPASTSLNRLENRVVPCYRNAYSGIRDCYGEDNFFRQLILERGCEYDASRSGKTNRVLQQIQQDLTNSERVAG
jgi:hypothetical protein